MTTTDAENEAMRPVIRTRFDSRDESVGLHLVPPSSADRSPLNLTLLLEFFAFLRLKYVEKDTERPFVVPFGNTGAWAITVPKILVLSGVLLAQKRHVWVTCGLFNVAVSSAYLVWRRFQPAPHAAAVESTTAYGTGRLS
uniref:Uncharacterized protein n=1 Tax=Phytophthora ramorum TaxID=164328 RepID=H3H8M7_PHYRM